MSRALQVMISVIWGLGLSVLFQRACKGDECQIIQGPDPNKIKGKHFKYMDDCIQYHPIPVPCDDTIPSQKYGYSNYDPRFDLMYRGKDDMKVKYESIY